MQLTPDQEKKIKRLILKFLGKSILCGLHHGLMAMVLLFIASLADLTFFEGSTAVLFVCSFAVGLFVFSRLNSVISVYRAQFVKQANEVIGK
jgi:hypothetical protein